MIITGKFISRTSTLPILISILNFIEILVGDAFLKVQQKVLDNFRYDVAFLLLVIVHVRMHPHVN